MEAFRRYDFENNENWKAYLRSVELPLARELDEATLRVKARWYKKNVDPDFDPNFVSRAGGGQPPSQGGLIKHLTTSAAFHVCIPHAEERWLNFPCLFNTLVRVATPPSICRLPCIRCTKYRRQRQHLKRK